MNENKKLPEWIDRFNNNTLHDSDLEEFLELLKQDPELRKEVRLDAELNKILADSDIIELRKKIIQNRIPEERDPRILPLLFLAASMTILITLGIMAFVWLHKEKTELLNAINKSNPDSISRFMTFPDSVAMEGDQKGIDSLSFSMSQELLNEEKLLLTENYKAFPPYESMVGEALRTNSFILVKPVHSDMFRQGDPVTFKWVTSASLPLTITITDNQGTILFTSGPIREKTFIFPTRKLRGGLYYVKFIREDEIVYFDKFTLN